MGVFYDQRPVPTAAPQDDVATDLVFIQRPGPVDPPTSPLSERVLAKRRVAHDVTDKRERCQRGG